MKTHLKLWALPLAAIVFGSLALPSAMAAMSGGTSSVTPGLTVIAEFKTPGLECELSGVYPHPQKVDQYYVVTDRHPACRTGQRPLLQDAQRGKLLLVDGPSGRILRSIALVDGDYGDIAANEGHLFISSLEPAEVLDVDLSSEKLVRRIPIAGPAGGLEFDRQRGALIAQLFARSPQLAVIDPRTGSTTATLWSDESAMGLAKVGSDLLCTWASSFDEFATSELRLLDNQTGKVVGRVPLSGGVHTAMAPLRRPDGASGFMVLVATDRTTGSSVVRSYAYEPTQVQWKR